MKEGTGEWRNAELSSLCNKVIVLGSKTVALMIFVGLHRLLDWVLRVAFNPQPRLETLIGSLTTIGFSLVYVAQLWDMMTLFLPAFSFLKVGKSKTVEPVPVTEEVK